MTLDKMLDTRNVNGKVYLSDVEDWVGFDLPFQQIVILRDKVSELNRFHVPLTKRG